MACSLRLSNGASSCQVNVEVFWKLSVSDGGGALVLPTSIPSPYGRKTAAVSTFIIYND